MKNYKRKNKKCKIITDIHLLMNKRFVERIVDLDVLQKNLAKADLR